ncbi:hypothetical protein LZ30DRAFT_448831 [Colletotrichum cereale]|nr:hypothetical protein LZ30DRAFT_448831 [Colletotrichum cereale]
MFSPPTVRVYPIRADIDPRVGHDPHEQVTYARGSPADLCLNMATEGTLAGLFRLPARTLALSVDTIPRLSAKNHAMPPALLETGHDIPSHPRSARSCKATCKGLFLLLFLLFDIRKLFFPSFSPSFCVWRQLGNGYLQRSAARAQHFLRRQAHHFRGAS